MKAVLEEWQTGTRAVRPVIYGAADPWNAAEFSALLHIMLMPPPNETFGTKFFGLGKHFWLGKSSLGRKEKKHAKH